MKVTLKTDMTWPRHGKVTIHAGQTIDVPNEVGLDWIKRDLAEEPVGFPSVQPKVK